MQQFISLGHNDAKLAIQAIKTELLNQNIAAVIAVTDVLGELIGLLRVDGAKPASILIAANKAWTAARERKSSRGIRTISPRS